jgi:hypothetical protein
MWSRDKGVEPSYVCASVDMYILRTNDCNVLMYTGHAILLTERTDVLTYR